MSRVFRVDMEQASGPDLLGWCLGEGADRLLMVVRSTVVGTRFRPPTELDQVARDLLRNHLLRIILAKRWPLTELVPGRNGRWEQAGLAYLGRFDGEVLERLRALEPRLDRWLHSPGPTHTIPLPEDLAVWKEGSPLPLLATCTHERLAWLVAPAPPGGVEGVHPVWDPGDALLDWLGHGRPDFLEPLRSFHTRELKPPSL